MVIKLNKQKKLLLQRNIFVLIILIVFGVIIISEKSAQFLIPKAEEKLTSYIDSNYSEIRDDIILGDVEYKNQKYQMKIKAKENSNYYFYLYYKNKKYSSTYKKDYVEGEAYFSYLKKKMSKDISKKTKEAVKINIINTLDSFTDKVQEAIIKEDNLLELKFYTIEKEFTPTKWKSDDICNDITFFVTLCQNKGINPKSYTFIITNSKDITQSIKITKITDEFIDNPERKQIIEDILNNKNSDLLKNNKISYKYLN